MMILGLNAYHGYFSACLIRDGEMIAAVEEERFRRQKHWPGLPVRSVEYCLGATGITLADVDHIAISRDPKANVLKKVLFTFAWPLFRFSPRTFFRYRNFLLRSFGTKVGRHSYIYNAYPCFKYELQSASLKIGCLYEC